MKCNDCGNLVWGNDEGEIVYGWCRVRQYCPDLGIERDCSSFLKKRPDALSTLQIENEKLRAELQKSEHDNVNLTGELAKVAAELERVKQLYESEKEDFMEFACSGIPNLSPFCFNRHPDCVDERGWCKTEKCRGFSRERGPEEG